MEAGYVLAIYFGVWIAFLFGMMYVNEWLPLVFLLMHVVYALVVRLIGVKEEATAQAPKES